MEMIKGLLDEKRLETFKVARAQIAKHIESAFQDLKEARTTFPVSDKAAYLFAYTAMLKIGRALLFLKGYRPKGQGQHETVVKVAGFTLGKDFESLTRQFNLMRQKRNKLIYDIGGVVSHEEAKKAFAAAEKYLEDVQQFMKKADPQLKLDL
jgi:uncharacterized protein (UPF0332 family)